jgi:hypothetical protein
MISKLVILPVFIDTRIMFQVKVTEVHQAIVYFSG